MHGCCVIHTVAVLVDRNAQTPADFLTTRYGVVAVLEHAHHKHVWVVPALSQRGVGEDEPRRLFERQQALLVL